MEREAMSGFAEEKREAMRGFAEEKRESGREKSGNFWRIFCSPVFYRPLPAARFQRIK